MQDLQQRLVKKGVAYYERFIDQRADDATLSADLALAHYRAAVLLYEVGRFDEAMGHFHRALGMQQALVDSNPGAFEPRRALAKTYIDLGDAHARQRQWSEAVGSFEQALANLDQLAAMDADSVVAGEVQRNRAGAFCNIGYVLDTEGDRSRAVPYYERAIATGRESVSKDRSQSNLETLARSLNNLSACQHQSGRFAEALTSYEETLQIRRAILERVPGDHRRQYDVAITCLNVGRLYLQKNDKKASAVAIGEAKEMLEKLVRENPLVAEYKRELQNCTLLAAWVLPKSK